MEDQGHSSFWGKPTKQPFCFKRFQVWFRGLVLNTQ